MQENNSLLEEIITCVSSALSFKANFDLIIDKVYDPNQTANIANFPLCIEKILTNPEASPTSKFYALLLILKVTEIEDDLSPEVISSVTQSKNLLNKIFQDAQFDKDKPFGIKGDKFFSKKPQLEESIIGNNYIRLTLEIIRFWSEVYGNEEKKTPGHIFFVMFKNLAGMAKFPETFHYIYRDYELTDDFHLVQDFGKDGQVVDQAAVNIKAFMQVSSCISSGNEYKLNSKVVFDSLAENSAVYSDSLIDTIAEILESKDHVPKSKFYALYLLIQVTETRNKVFMTRFSHRKNLLTKFAQIVLIDASGKERGERLFPEIANTPDSVIGKNYITLLVEAIKFWDVAFGSDDINSPFNAFRTLDSSIWEFVRVPKDYYYVSQNLDPEGGVLGKSLSVIEFPPMILDEPLSAKDERVRAFDPETALDHVDMCTASSAGFRENYKHVIEALQVNNLQYIKIFLEEIFKVLTSSSAKSISKFYALFLLAKATESGNENLIESLERSKELLSKLYHDAQIDKAKSDDEKGLTIFKEDTFQAGVLGNTYIKLLLELLLFWNHNHGNQEKGAPGFIFYNMYNALSTKKIHFPSKFVYVGRDINATITELEHKLDPSKQKSSTPGTSSELEKARQKNQENDVEDIAVQLSELDNIKYELLQTLRNNQNETPQVKSKVSALIENAIQIYAQNLEPKIAILTEKSTGSPDNQKYISRIFTEGDFIDMANEKSFNYKNKTLAYPEFRAALLNLLEEQKVTSPELPQDNGANKILIEAQKQSSHLKVSNLTNVTTDNKNTVAVNFPLFSFPSNLSPSKNTNSMIEKQSPATPQLSMSQQKPPVRGLNADKVFDSQRSTGKRRIPEDKLMSSLKEIEKSINTSKVKTADLTQIEESIRRSYARSGKKPPAFEPLDELKRKQRLEEEIDRLKKEKLNLSKEASFMRSQLLQSSPGSHLAENEEDPRHYGRSSERSSRFEESLNSNPALKEYQQLVDDLQRKVENTNQELQKKNYEVENLKKATMNESEVQRIKKENSTLKAELDTYKKELNVIRTNSGTSSSDQSQLKQQMSSADRTNRSLMDKIEDVQHKNTNLSSKILNTNEPNRSPVKNEEMVPREGKLHVQKTGIVYGGAEANSKNSLASSRSNRASQIITTSSKSEFIIKSPPPVHNMSLEDYRTAINTERSIYKTQPTSYHEKSSLRTDRSGGKNGHHSGPRYTPEKRSMTQTSAERFDTPMSQSRRLYDDDNVSEMSYLNTAKAHHEILETVGQLIETHHNTYFEELKKDLTVMSHHPNELANFKLNCLKTRSSLYDSEALQIGLASVLLIDSFNKRRLLKTIIYYANKTHDFIDNFNVNIQSNNSLTLVLKPETIHTTVEPGRQIKQQVISLPQIIPFENPKLLGNYEFNHKQYNFGFHLPSVITKFMEFKFVDIGTFERQWQKNTDNILKTDLILLDSEIVSAGHDFKKYFNYLVDLKIMDEYDYIQGRKSLDLGGLFELDVVDVEYLLKISVFPSRKATFQIVADKKDFEVAKFILETLVFLFKA